MEEEAGETVPIIEEIKELEEGNDSQPSLPSVTYRDLESCEGEGAFPIEKLKETLQALDDRIIVKSGNLHCSVDALPMFGGEEGEYEEEIFDEYYSDPIINFGSNHEDTTTSEEFDPVKQLDFENDLFELYPKFFDEGDDATTEVILTNISDKTYGTITLDALEALGRSRVKKNSNRQITNTMYWADVCHPTLEVVQQLEHAFGFHPLTTEDVFITSTREKVEEFPKYLYIVFAERQFEPNSNNVRLANVNILLFRNFILSIHIHPVRCFSPVLYQLCFGKETVSTVEWVAYKFMDVIADDLMIRTKAVQNDVRQIDGFVMQMVGSDSQEDFILRIAVARQSIAELQEFLNYKRDILRFLSSKKLTVLKPYIKLYIRDILDHVVHMLQQLQHLEDILNNVNATYLALVSIKMAEGSNQMNAVMKRFSAVATIVLPLTLISSLWGMNVEVPGQTWGLGLLWFGLIVVVMCCWLCLAMIWFKKNRWV